MRKRTFSLLIILLIVSQLFVTNAAIVAESDGLTFVTKREFDNLKSSFSQQIDGYNDSISRKIDGAIGSYLDGIQVAPTEVRNQLINGLSSWTMYGEDYPKYVDGYPYVTGFTAQGHSSSANSGTHAGNTFLMCTFNGDANYLTNGGFKKHIVGKPSQNSTKNGNTNYVAEWQGYYQNEGEQVSCAYFAGAEDSVWACSLETVFQFDAQAAFSNNACPVTIAHCRVRTPDSKGFTTYDVRCSAVQRIVGNMVGDTCVSIYKTISDNRFYDSTVANRMGITPTNPAITYKAKGNTFTNNFKISVPSAKFDLANGYYDLSGGRWVAHTEGGLGWGADVCNFYTSTNVNVYSVENANTEHYYWKMANDPNNLQFDRLWTAKTDSIAKVLNTEYETTTDATKKDKLKKALLWDSSNVPHLSMGAGYPFLSVEDGEKVTFNFKISSGTYTGDFYVFAKYGPFSSTGDPESEADVTFESGTVATHPKAFKATAGKDAQFVINTTKTDNIFLKWVTSDMKNGGVMDVSDNPTVVLKIE